MTSIVVPRWTLMTVALAIIASVALSIGAYSTVFSQSQGQDEPLYACMYAGALSQVSQTPPTNCGRGTLVSWPSYDDFVALQQQLGTDVSDLHDLIDALTQRVSDLESENEDLQEAILQLTSDLADEAEAREGADNTIHQMVQQQQQMILVVQDVAQHNADNLSDLADSVDNLFQTVLGLIGEVSDILGDIGDMAGQITSLITNLGILSDTVSFLEDIVCAFSTEC